MADHIYFPQVGGKGWFEEGRREEVGSGGPLENPKEGEDRSDHDKNT